MPAFGYVRKSVMADEKTHSPEVRAEARSRMGM